MSSQLRHYLDQWNLSNPHLIAETPTSQVYTVIQAEQIVILKLLTPIGVEDERNGAVALKHFDGHGAVRLLHVDHRAHLLEYADGEDLVPMVERGEDTAATAIIAETLNKLHAKPVDVPPPQLTPLNRRFRSLFQKAENERAAANHDSIFIRAAAHAETLLTSQREMRVLHGDMHHGNIRRHAKRGWLAFDPKGLYGERTFDVANTLCNPPEMPELVYNEARLLENAGIFAEAMRIDLSRILSFTYVHFCLSEVWMAEDDPSYQYDLRLGEILESHVLSKHH